MRFNIKYRSEIWHPNNRLLALLLMLIRMPICLSALLGMWFLAQLAMVALGRGPGISWVERWATDWADQIHEKLAERFK